jgi:hypothetical protein
MCSLIVQMRECKKKTGDEAPWTSPDAQSGMAVGGRRHVDSWE